MTERRADGIERIVLVGLSGSGKSTIGRCLAARLGWPMADTDEWIVAETGRTIPDLFASEGEPAFRRLEQAALRALTARAPLVLATGGGIVTVPENWPLMRARARVVWLQATPEQLVARLHAQRGEGVAAVRPLLAGDPLARLQAMLAARGAFYAQADVAVETAGRTPEEVVDALLTTIEPTGPAAPPAAARGRETG